MRRITMIILASLCLTSFLNPFYARAEDKTEERIYVVKDGDTPADILFTLEGRYKIPKGKILGWNPKMGLHLIYPGQKIKYYLTKDASLERKYPFLLIIVSFIISIIVIFGSVIFKKTERPKTRVEIKIVDKMYDYYPQIDKDGKYISLHRNKDEIYLRFQERGDLRKSVKGSFKKYPILIEEEIKAGRLVLQKIKGGGRK